MRQNKVARELGIPATSVCRILKDWRKDGKLKADKRIGHTLRRVLSNTHE